ncbi:MAG: TlpA family protein disulfide reductase, partial [Vulcanimicrobiaceae bacterium]
MKDSRRPILYATVAVLAIVFIGVIGYLSRTPTAVPKSASAAPEVAQLKVGQPAPNFTVSTTAGAFNLAKATGKPVLLEVFATWCPHCQHETTALDEIYAAYGGRIAMVAVSGSQYGMNGTDAESPEDVITFAKDFSVHYPIAFDPSLEVARQYLQGGFPTIVVIGKDGKIRYVASGETPV